ncbi:hypothetical protein BX616_006396 [Lobosporangium transversale]|nr:hypothetical protein BX616_006396 [Lobosporangium transversale]
MTTISSSTITLSTTTTHNSGNNDTTMTIDTCEDPLMMQYAMSISLTNDNKDNNSSSIIDTNGPDGQIQILDQDQSQNRSHSFSPQELSDKLNRIKQQQQQLPTLLHCPTSHTNGSGALPKVLCPSGTVVTNTSRLYAHSRSQSRTHSRTQSCNHSRSASKDKSSSPSHRHSRSPSYPFKAAYTSASTPGDFRAYQPTSKPSSSSPALWSLS